MLNIKKLVLGKFLSEQISSRETISKNTEYLPRESISKKTISNNREYLPRKILLSLALFSGLYSIEMPAYALDAAKSKSSITENRANTFLEENIATAFQHYQLAGLAVGIIENGEITYTYTAGELMAGSGQKINADSLFKIASTSKAMTTGVMARLVDAGKLKWDDPVIKYLPNFKMHDPWVTQNIQVRDLLIHNAGLGDGAGDLLMWPEPNQFNRDDIINALAYLKPTYSFRSKYTYDNLMYVVAGEVAAAAAGESFEKLVQRELFQPLNMQRCQVGEWNREQVGNVAQPHQLTEKGNQVIRADGEVIPDMPSTAAGGIRCSLNDMLKWMSMWLDPNSTWISKKQKQILWSAHMPLNISQRMRDWDNTHFYSYGYGWRLSDVDGRWKVTHTGTLAGMYTSLILFPDQKNGAIILINGSGDDARSTLSQVITKYFTQPEKQYTTNYYANLIDSKDNNSDEESVASPAKNRVTASPKTLTTWMGIYNDPWFGNVSICPDPKDKKKVQFISKKSDRLHGIIMQSDNKFLVDWEDISVGAEPWLNFSNENNAVKLKLTHVITGQDSSFNYPDMDFTKTEECSSY